MNVKCQNLGIRSIGMGGGGFCVNSFYIMYNVRNYQDDGE